MSSIGPGTSADDLVKTEANRLVYQRLAELATKHKKHPAIQAFWKYLLLCFETPRPSTDYVEPDIFARLDLIRKALGHVAKAFGAEVVEDPAGNLIIRCEGKGSGTDKPFMCLQGHLDMVVSQNEGVGHNFETDPIEVRFSSDDGIEDGWLKPVKATTLGADNGVSLAASLAILETCESYPPLELFFTSNEETNFHGAENLAPGTLKSKRLLNLDSEEEYTIILGSAGIFEHHYKLPVERSTTIPPDLCPISVKLAGLHGGHSGVDIHKYYGNANKLIARLMIMVSRPGDEVRLLWLSGGSGPTAIPREASCVVLVPKDSAEAFIDELSDHFNKLKEEIQIRDPGLELKVAACPESAPQLVENAALPEAVAEQPMDIPPAMAFKPALRPPKKKKKFLVDAFDCSRCEKCVAKAIAAGMDIGSAENTKAASRLGPLTPASTRRAWLFCSNLPSGVLSMSSEGQTESSVNFGVVNLLNDHLFCHLCVRSSSLSFLESYQKTLSGFGELSNATNAENICPASPWQPKFDSKLLETLKRTHVEEFAGKEPHVTVCHGGLEPGALMDSHPDLDCCSIGPEIKNPHSPDERVNIASAERFVEWLKRILEALALEES